MAKPTVTTRVLIISDTHCAGLEEGSNGDENTPQRAFSVPLPAADLLIHCGDLTHKGQMDQYQGTLDMLAKIEAPVKLVIAGNHDLTLDRDFVLGHLQQQQLTAEEAAAQVKEARDVWTSPTGRARKEGITFLDEGVHSIDLANGARATVYATPYTPEFWDWGFPYERDEDRFNTPSISLSDAKNIAPYPIPSASTAQPPLDILITHGPPWQNLDETTRGEYAGCPHLLRSLMRARPLLHCFGHIHEGWGAEVVRWSERADEVTTMPTTIQEWKDGAWQSGIAHNGLQSVSVSAEKMLQRHAAYLDITKLQQGRETALVNAAIMDVMYQPVNAPWLIEMELPKGPSVV